MAREVTIEILIQQEARWQIHAQYPEAQREAAIEEAKALSKVSGNDSAKMLRKVYDSETGSSTESTLYRWSSTETKSGADAGARVDGGGGSWSPPPSTMRADSGGDKGRSADKEASDDEDDTPKRRRSKKAVVPGPPRKPSSAGGVVVKLLLVTLDCIAVATGATMVLAEALPHKTLFGVSMVGDSRANALFIVFVAVFLTNSIPLARSLLSKVDLSAAPPPPGGADAGQADEGGRRTETVERPRTFREEESQGRPDIRFGNRPRYLCGQVIQVRQPQWLRDKGPRRTDHPFRGNLAGGLDGRGAHPTNRGGS